MYQCVAYIMEHGIHFYRHCLQHHGWNVGSELDSLVFSSLRLRAISIIFTVTAYSEIWGWQSVERGCIVLSKWFDLRRTRITRAWSPVLWYFALYCWDCPAIISSSITHPRNSWSVSMYCSELLVFSKKMGPTSPRRDTSHHTLILTGLRGVSWAAWGFSFDHVRIFWESACAVRWSCPSSGEIYQF